MAGIFNFPYLQLNEILKVSEQTYTINMNYNFAEFTIEVQHPMN